MYNLKQYKRLSYLVMYTAFNNMALESVNGIYDFMHSNSCKISSLGTTKCKDCKYSINVSIQIGSCSIHQALCIYCINKLYVNKMSIDDAFRASPTMRSKYFKIMKRRILGYE